MAHINSSLSIKLGYVFQDHALLERALTHCSLKADNNERLEFLGDAVLGFSIAEILFHLYPQAEEGELSRLRAYLVKREQLSLIAQTLNLGNYILLGNGEVSQTILLDSAILADAVEAVLAAIYLDAGLDVVMAVIKKLYNSVLYDPLLFSRIQDAKSRLQEYCQANKMPLPTYKIIKTIGAAHNQVFHVQCQIKDNAGHTTGIGRTRRKAEQEAASLYLEQCSFMS